MRPGWCDAMPGTAGPLTGGAPDFWRALTDNDIGTGVTSRTRCGSSSPKTAASMRWAERATPSSCTTTWAWVGQGGHALDDGGRWHRPRRRTVHADPRHAARPLARRPDLRDATRARPCPLVRPGAAGNLFRSQDRGSDRDLAGRARRPVSRLCPPAGVRIEAGRALDRAVGSGTPSLRVTGAQPLAVNALPFPYSDLSTARHSSDIRPHGDGTLLIDAAQAGVGGDTGWSLDGRPHMRSASR